MRFSPLLAAAVTAVLSFTPSAARADLLPDGMTHVPVEIALDNQNAMPDTSLVLVGCSSPEGGRHSFEIAKPGAASRCSIKMGITVYAIPTKDVKPLEELRAKDVGWAEEGQQVKKLTEKATECGKINETSLVETSKKIAFLTARYSLEKTTTGCSIKKVGETVPQTASSGAPSATPSSSASSAPSASASNATAPTKSGGCGACSVVTKNDPSTTTRDGVLTSIALLAGVCALSRRHRRRASKATDYAGSRMK